MKREDDLPVIISPPRLSHSSRRAPGSLTRLPIHYTVIQSPLYCRLQTLCIDNVSCGCNVSLSSIFKVTMKRNFPFLFDARLCIGGKHVRASYRLVFERNGSSACFLMAKEEKWQRVLITSVSGQVFTLGYVCSTLNLLLS